MELMGKQIETFQTDGFLVIRNLLLMDQVDEINVGYQKAISGQIDAHDWKKRINSVSSAQLGDPSAVLGWRQFLYFQQILSIAKQLNGEDIEVAYDQLIYKPPHSLIEVLWHQDAGYGPWPEEAVKRGLTCWLALVDATPKQGSMQFIPGSHRQGIYRHYNAQDRNPIGGALEVRLDDQEAVAVSYQAGDCSFHHACTLHYIGRLRIFSNADGSSAYRLPRKNPLLIYCFFRGQNPFDQGEDD